MRLKNNRDKEIMSVILEGSDDEKASCGYFEEKPKSKLQQTYIENAKKKMAMRDPDFITINKSKAGNTPRRSKTVRVLSSA